MVAATLLAMGFFSAFQVFSEAYAITSGDEPKSLQNDSDREWKRRSRSFVREDYVKYRVEEGYFECEVLDKWIDLRDKEDDRRTGVYGMALVLKNSQPGIKPIISIDYYAPDNHYFSSADHYLSRQFEPSFFTLEGEKISEIREVAVNGNKARQFARDTFGFWPPHSMDTKKIRVHEEYTVLEAKEGFFLLRYSAPDNQFTSYRPDYQHILDTFEPFPAGAPHGKGGISYSGPL
jgi:hypothetical protein